jgi:probable rRNA maturation factor
MKLICPEISYCPSLSEIEIAAISVLSKYKKNLVDQTTENEIHINFIDDKQIQELNNLHRQKNAPTDVLSWSFIDENLADHELAGELYISIETAKKYAKRDEQTLQQKIDFLIIHGLLHIFHYDHQNDEQESEMDSVTVEILSCLT